MHFVHFGRDGDLTLSGGIFDGIIDQIDQDLMQSITISSHCREGRRDMLREGHFPTLGFLLYHIKRFLDQLGDEQFFAVELGPAKF